MMLEDRVVPKHLPIVAGRLVGDARVGQSYDDAP